MAVPFKSLDQFRAAGIKRVCSFVHRLEIKTALLQQAETYEENETALGSFCQFRSHE